MVYPLDMRVLLKEVRHDRERAAGSLTVSSPDPSLLATSARVTWVVEDWAANNGVLKSGCFWIGPFVWQLAFYPHGYGGSEAGAKPGYTGLLLTVQGQQKVRADFTLTICNKLTPQFSKTVSGEVNLIHKKARGGMVNMCRRRDLLGPQDAAAQPRGIQVTATINVKGRAAA